MVSYHGPIYLNCIFLAFCPHLKVTQLFFKAFNLPEYMVGWCGEQLCEQVLLCRPLCFQKTPHSTPTFVHLQSLPNFSGLIFLHSNQNQDHFPNPRIKGFQDINLKISHSLKIGAFIAGLANIYVSGKKHKKINE